MRERKGSGGGLTLRNAGQLMAKRVEVKVQTRVCVRRDVRCNMREVPHQSMPISSEASRAAVLVGIMPCAGNGEDSLHNHKRPRLSA